MVEAIYNFLEKYISIKLGIEVRAENYKWKILVGASIVGVEINLALFVTANLITICVSNISMIIYLPIKP